MTDSARARYYLNALGIRQWQSRFVSTSAAALDHQHAASGKARHEVSHRSPAEQLEPVSPTAVVETGSALLPEPGGDEAMVNLRKLAAEVAVCQRCELHQNRKQAVFGIGNPLADWLIIGEAPGAEEDRLGQPFVGRAGKLLDKMLAAIGLDRQSAYIANIIKCRPSQNRDPRNEEIEQCLGYLQQQIAEIRPKIILLVGRIAAQTLLESTLPIGKLRGKVYSYKPYNIPMVVTYHPAYLLRSPSEKQKSWQDLMLARENYQLS